MSLGPIWEKSNAVYHKSFISIHLKWRGRSLFLSFQNKVSIIWSVQWMELIVSDKKLSSKEQLLKIWDGYFWKDFSSFTWDLKIPQKKKQKILADAKRCCSGRGEKESKMQTKGKSSLKLQWITIAPHQKNATR